MSTERHEFSDSAKLQRLADDIRRIAAGAGPTPEELDGSPVLEDWTFQKCGVYCLAGLARNHPRLGSQSIVTSQLYAISDDRTWARTYSRFYRLISPVSGDEDVR